MSRITPKWRYLSSMQCDTIWRQTSFIRRLAWCRHFEIISERLFKRSGPSCIVSSEEGHGINTRGMKFVSNANHFRPPLILYKTDLYFTYIHPKYFKSLFYFLFWKILMIGALLKVSYSYSLVDEQTFSKKYGTPLSTVYKSIRL